MTTNYPFQVVYTKLGLATSPSVAPTLTVVDSNNVVVLNSVTTVPLGNIAGLYTYTYVGADNLKLYGLFHTSDSTVDQQDLFSYNPSFGVTPQQIWEYSMRTLTSNPITSPPGSAITSYLTQEPGKLDVSMRWTDDLSFDVDLGVDLTLYDLEAWIYPVLNDPISIVITETDITTGKLHFYISDESIADLSIVSNKHKWAFKIITPKAATLPTEQFTRTILSGHFNLTQ